MTKSFQIQVFLMAAFLLSQPSQASKFWKKSQILQLHPFFKKVPLKTVHFQIKGKKRHFLFDTGGGITTVTPTLAKELGCKPQGKITAFRMLGQKITMPLCYNLSLPIAGTKQKHAHVGVFPLNKLIPKHWPRLSGMLTLHSFEGKVLTYKPKKRQVVLESKNSFSKQTKGLSSYPMRFGRQAGGASLDVFFAVPVKSFFLWLEYDTGNTGFTYLSPHAASLLGFSKKDMVPHKLRSGKVIQMIPKGHISIQGFGRKHTKLSVKELIYDGVIGKPFVSHGQVTLDLQSKQYWVRQ